MIIDDVEERPDAIDAVADRGDLRGSRTLVVIAGDDDTVGADRRGATERIGAVIRPSPLDLDDVREIAALYLGKSADALRRRSSKPPAGYPVASIDR